MGSLLPAATNLLVAQLMAWFRSIFAQQGYGTSTTSLCSVLREYSSAPCSCSNSIAAPKFGMLQGSAYPVPDPHLHLCSHCLSSLVTAPLDASGPFLSPSPPTLSPLVYYLDASPPTLTASLSSPLVASPPSFSSSLLQITRSG